MFTVDPVAIAHYPCYLTMPAPYPFPIFELKLLDPSVSIAYYRERAAAAAHHKWSWLLLGRGRSIKFLHGREPQPSDPPSGFFRLWPIQWDWRTGITADGPDRIQVAVHHPKRTGLRMHTPYPFVAVESQSGGMCFAPVSGVLKTDPTPLRKSVASFAIRERKVCYVVLEEKRAIRVLSDGSWCPVDGLPESQASIVAPIARWDVNRFPL